MAYEPGSVIAGKYRVERMLGEGGMGIVLAARHLGLDEMVAVKLIKEERAAGTDAIARFQREARAAARIKSEHVARVLDVDRSPEGEPYIVMELIDGTDLHALVNRRKKLAPDEAASFLVQACEGLAEAHALGMVHRDLKLKNLFLTKRRDGRALIKVIDFGVVKLAPIAEDDDVTHASNSGSNMGRMRVRDATLTNATALVGSVHYMAPEQIRASNVVDARADVWSLGVCLYAMLTGMLPFEGDTVAAVLYQIQGLHPRDIRDHVPSLPGELAAVVTHALEKDAGRRFQSVAELSAALAPFHTDVAAQLRIETILASSVKPGGRAMPYTSAADVGGETQDMAPVATAFRGRAESTIDAAAIGSLSTHAPTTRRSPLVTGAVVMMVAAGVTGLVWSRRAQVRPEPEAQVQAVQPAATPTPTPVETAPPIPSVLPAPPTAATPAASIVVATPKPTTKRGAKPKHEPAPPKTDPKPEPTGAYDKF